MPLGIVWAFFGIVAAAGLYTSAKALFAYHALDADMADTPMLWYGVHRHGWAFLTQWRYTPDNWLLSLAPLHFLLFFLAGPRPLLVFTLGWVIFIANLLMLGLIARQVDGRIAAALTPVTLLFCGREAQLHGMVTYPVSHGVTLFWGLLAFHAALRWLRRHRPASLALGFAATLIGGVSDPWLLAAFALPLILACAVAWMIDQDRARRQSLIRLALVQSIAVIGIKTRLFGLCHFLTGYSFRLGDWRTIRANCGFFFRDLGGLFNIVPDAHDHALTPAVLSLCALAGFAIPAFAMVRRALPRTDLATSVFFLTGLLSVAGVAAAFILGAMPAGAYSARYLINILFLTPLLISVAFDRAGVEHDPFALAHGSCSTSLFCRAIHVSGDSASDDRALARASYIIPAWSAAACLFIAAGLISNAAAWRQPGFRLRDNGIPAMLAFLQRHHLGAGYGSYWGASANAASWYAALRHEDIRIRPVVFSPYGTMIIGTRAQSSALWAHDLPPRSGESDFVMLGNGGAQCPDIDLCALGLSEQFGLPQRRIAWNHGLILVWAHPLADWTIGQK